jgi:hypothetical protein
VRLRVVRQGLLEQASQDHHAIVRALNTLLTAVGCADVSEIPGAIDLWASRPDGSRMIFEVKTISVTNEVTQTRGARGDDREHVRPLPLDSHEHILPVQRRA